MKRSQALDAVRGIAIVLVLIWHYVPRVAETPGLLLGAIRLFWSGVDLFFVLSGFLIAGILLQNVNSRNYFSTFYIRRGSRILPLYLVVFLVFIMVIYLGAASLAADTQRHLPLWSYLTFTQNFLYAARGGMNDPWMDVTWSLAVEEQFYIFLSLLIRHLNKMRLLVLTIGLILLAPVLRFYAPNIAVAYVLPLQRADSLMLGVLLAQIWQWDKGREFLCKYASLFRWSIIIFLLGFVYLTYRNIGAGNPFTHFWLALFYGNFIVLALTLDESQRRFNVFRSGVLEWFGLRSYGIYLLHKPVQILTPFILAWFLRDSLSPWITAIISMIALFLVSELSYRILEKPVMSLGHHFKYK